VKDFLKALREGRRFLVCGHLRADGDCLGTEAVFHHVLLALGKESRILNPDPPDPRFAFLAEQTPFERYEGILPPSDGAVICDCCELSRLGELGKDLLERRVPLLLVDHHPLNEEARAIPWRACAHDSSASASGMIALRVAHALGVELPRGAREAAFLALATDTGWFRHRNADPETWQAAAELVASGVDSGSLFRRALQRSSPAVPRGIAAALENLRYAAGGRIALAGVDGAGLAVVDGLLPDADEVLEILRGVEGVELVGVLFPGSDGGLKLSLRSQGDLDVSAVARRFGGGGHLRAAGARFPSGWKLDQAMEAVEEALRALLRP